MPDTPPKVRTGRGRAAALYLVGILYGTHAFSRKRSDKKRYPRPYVRRRHYDAFKLRLEVVPYHHRPVRVAEDDLGAHVYQSVDEEQTAFKHLLVDEHTATCLGGHYQHNAQQIRRKARPWCISNG